MNKNEAISHAILLSTITGNVSYVRDYKGVFFVNHDKATAPDTKWHGTAKLGKYHTKASIRAKANCKAREAAMESCGLVKVRGAVSGKIYWE